MCIICLADCIVYLFCIFSRFIIYVIYVQSTYMLCYVILCYAMVGCWAMSCPKNLSAQPVFFCSSELELELTLRLP